MSEKVKLTEALWDLARDIEYNLSPVHRGEPGVTVHEILGFGGQKVEPGHYYEVRIGGDERHQRHLIMFQDGPIPANGVNGATSEALLAMLIHRTSTLNGNFPCEENELAILHMKKALDWFNTRTAKRKQRGVEGRNIV